MPGDAGAGEGVSDAGVDAYVPGVPDATTALSPEERFLRDYHQAHCERAVRCAIPTWQPDWPWGPPAELCHPALADWLSRTRGFLADGAIVFRPETAAECLESLAPPPACGIDSYASFDWSPSPCSPVFVGTRLEGEACRFIGPGQCAAGLYCDAPDWGEPGVCTVTTARGEACEEYRECEGWPWEGMCYDGICLVEGREGDPCPGPAYCGYPLQCVEGTCQEPYVGMPCGDVSCGPVLHCIDGSCAEGAPEGDPCDDGCSYRTTCWGDPPVCTSSDGHDIGDVCWVHSFLDDDTCLDGLVCLPELIVRSGSGMGRCVAGQPDGATCDESSPCTKGSRCVDGACVGMVLPGERCGSDAACPLTHACIEGRCEPLPTPGEACVPGVGCLQGRCVEGVCCLAAEWTACDPSASEPVLSICASDCLSDEMCGRPLECDPACAGHTCWRTSDRCAPACPAP